MAAPMRENGSKDSGAATETNPPRIDPTEYSLRKRLPRRLPRRKNDVYVSNKTDFKAQMARCHQLMESGAAEVFVHGLGAAVHRAVSLALQLQRSSLGTLQLSVNTSTVELVDDLEPRGDDGEPGTRERNNSAVHIRLWRADEAEGVGGRGDRVGGDRGETARLTTKGTPKGKKERK